MSCSYAPFQSPVLILVPGVACGLASEHHRSNDLPVAEENTTLGALARHGHRNDVTLDRVMASRDVVERGFEQHHVHRASAQRGQHLPRGTARQLST